MSRFKIGVLFATIQIIFYCFVSLPSWAADADPRSPVPDAAARAAAIKVAREAFSADLRAAKSPAEKSAVAKKMLQTAEDSKAAAADWYSLLDLARTTAAGIPDVDTAFLAVDRMRASFVVDDVDLSADTIIALASATHLQPDRTVLLTAAQNVVGKCISADRYGAAKDITKLGLAEARKTGSVAAVKDWQILSVRIDSLGKAYLEVVSASKVLEKTPDDPAANLTVGRYKCFDKGQWSVGLPLLARGNDPQLSELAKRDIAGASDAAAQSTLGDAWWDLAEKRAATAGQFRGRAAFWYARAAPGLAGLERAKVEHRIKEIEASANPLEAAPVSSGGSAGRVVDLLQLISVANDTVAGDFALTPAGLTVKKAASPRLQIPYRPPEEYDLVHCHAFELGSRRCGMETDDGINQGRLCHA